MPQEIDNKIQVIKMLREKRSPKVAGLEPEIDEKVEESKERNMLKMIGNLIEKLQVLERED